MQGVFDFERFNNIERQISSRPKKGFCKTKGPVCSESSTVNFLVPEELRIQITTFLQGENHL